MKTKGIPSCTGTPGQPRLLPVDRDCTLHIAISHYYYYYISGVTHLNAMNSKGTVGR